LAMLIQRNLEFVHRIALEPRLVHWAHARRWPDRHCDVLLTLHSRTDKTLEIPLSQEQMIKVVAWLRRHNPDIRCGA
jgi:hypothetical protein